MKVGTVGLGAALVAMAAWAQPGAAQDVFTWDRVMEEGQTIRIEGISGSIRATRASGSSVEVRAEKDGRSSDFDDVEIVVDETRDGVTICAIYGVRDATDCDDDDRNDGDRRRRSINVSVDFEIEVPAGVLFEGSQVSGEIVAEDLDSDVRASTVSGDIFVTTSGIAEARTVSGSIEVEMGSADFRALDFATVSGDIRVLLPANADADIEFSSLSGDFDTDFDLSVASSKRRFVGAEFSGTLGSGGPDLTFKTVSGDVELYRYRVN